MCKHICGILEQKQSQEDDHNPNHHAQKGERLVENVERVVVEVFESKIVWSIPTI
jgi:hypothetical protein